MKDKQNKIFFNSEGDEYFKRNIRSESNHKIDSDIPIKILELYNISPKKVLEIGCFNGFRLNWIKEKFRCECYGIEPSKLAVEEGLKKFNGIKITRGVFSEVPFEDKFDLIIINFVFHWIDRDLLAKCISEVERLLLPGGFLLIGDFFPDYPQKNRYTHIEEKEVWTYKQDYSKLFLALENYSLIALLTSSFSEHDFVLELNDDERKAYTLLWKRKDV